MDKRFESRICEDKRRIQDVIIINAIHVVVAVIEDSSEHFLISKRLKGQHLAGFWEFPGGKVDSGESVKDALSRELKEELGIEVKGASFVTKIEYDYPEKSVILHVFHVVEFEGQAHGCEGQEVRWVLKSDLSDFEFPPANEPILRHFTGGE